ncbi:PRC-barrel domain-containing protein [Aureimonas mangrovi]|uniref:PRC-barrel domain-containing protein n=1 Tax=Aureimonas mangrovi TaxID=2758041 RepID=UPI00163DCFA9|nr:PRC-barrel domain-containing protein [Aureimonas mangrovi]
MIRTLLITSATAVALLGPAAAQTGTRTSGPTGDRVAPSPAAPAAETPAPAARPGFTFLTVMNAEQHLFTNLVGAPLFLAATPDEVAADIQDVIVGADGTALALVVRTQGAIEGKSRLLAIPFDRLSIAPGDTAAMAITITASADELAAAPLFDASAQAPDPAPADTLEAPDYPSTLGPDRYLASTLVGDAVYDGPAGNAATIGNVADLVIGASGTVDAFTVGVGGFLGIGEKTVGVPFDAIALGNDADGETHPALAVSRTQLEEAPTFVERPLSTLAPAGSAASDLAGTGAQPAQDAPVTASSLAPGPELTADALIGTQVFGPDREPIGTISDIALGTSGLVDAIVIDVGGFLGIGSKPVAMSMDNLSFTAEPSGAVIVTTRFTKAQLEEAPAFDSAPGARSPGADRSAPLAE